MNEKLLRQYFDVFSYEQNLKLYNEILKRKFTYGEYDLPHLPPTGLICNLSNDDALFLKLNDKVLEVAGNNILNKKLYRAYVNLFMPNENPFFHPDLNCITCLFYFNPHVELDDGGETQFFINDQLTGILPFPGSMVIFDGSILHRATSFRTKPRITVALKYVAVAE